MEASDLLSKRNLLRVKNLRSVAARYKQQSDLARILDWTPSYLSQLIGPNPSRPITEKSARAIERKLELQDGLLDSEASLPPEVKDAASGDLLDNVMVAVDSALSKAGWKLSEENYREKYRALVSYLFKTAAKRGDSQIDQGEVDTLLRLVR